MKKFIGISMIVLLCLLYLPFRLILPYSQREKLLCIFDLPVFQFMGKIILLPVLNLIDETFEKDNFLDVLPNTNDMQNVPEKIKNHSNPLRVVHAVTLIDSEGFLVFQQPNDYRSKIK